MATGVSVDDKDVRALLDRLTGYLRDPTVMLRSMGKTMETRVQTRFATKTAPDGSAWKPWARSTAAIRMKSGGTLLQFTGHMKDSLVVDASRGGLEIGFGATYAPYVESGTKHMPARHVLFDAEGQLAAPDGDALVQAAADLLRKQLGLGVE